MTPTLSATVGYVYTNAWNLQTGVGNNQVTQLFPAGTNLTNLVPFPDFNRGGSYQQTIGESDYNGLQTKLEQTYWKGLNFLASVHLVQDVFRCIRLAEWRKRLRVPGTVRARPRYHI